MRDTKYQIAYEGKVYPVTALEWDGAGLWVTFEKGQITLSDRAALREFTGLKDKNGKEIYEGDIVEYTYSSGEKYVYSVGWHKEAAAFHIYGPKDKTSWGQSIDSLHGSTINNQVEVIGDIYKNPELLKEN